MVNLSIFLYGKPILELGIVGTNKLNPEIFKKHGEELKERLDNISQNVKKLQDNGWILVELSGSLYSLELYKNNITKTEAKKQLESLGINLNGVNLD